MNIIEKIKIDAFLLSFFTLVLLVSLTGCAGSRSSAPINLVSTQKIEPINNAIPTSLYVRLPKLDANYLELENVPLTSRLEINRKNIINSFRNSLVKNLKDSHLYDEITTNYRDNLSHYLETIIEPNPVVRKGFFSDTADKVTSVNVILKLKNQKGDMLYEQSFEGNGFKQGEISFNAFPHFLNAFENALSDVLTKIVVQLSSNKKFQEIAIKDIEYFQNSTQLIAKKNDNQKLIPKTKFFSETINNEKNVQKIFLPSITTEKDKRFALVIGNSNYKNLPLANPVNDASDITAKLSTYGFNVEKIINADERQMKTAINRFGKNLQKNNSVGLFYFAGHGIQVDGYNYLIPLNANIENEADVEYEAVNANRILSKMSLAGNGLNIVILDACRNNPYARSFRGSNNGLARLEAPTGSLILYATSPGKVAIDGKGRNGLFTKNLLENMDRGNLKIEEIFKQTAIAVSKASSQKQVPYFEGVILSDFYFKRNQ